MAGVLLLVAAPTAGSGQAQGQVPDHSLAVYPDQAPSSGLVRVLEAHDTKSGSCYLEDAVRSRAHPGAIEVDFQRAVWEVIGVDPL